MLVDDVLCFAEKDIHVYFHEQKPYFRVVDVFKACEYKWDVTNFYNRHKSTGCKSWRKGPKSCWYCDVDDLCERIEQDYFVW